jgi:hydrogenase nickel incorporation protein HypA/HybF
MLMHETIVAQSLMAIISQEAVKQSGRPVAAKVSCGTLNAVNDEVLVFAFEAIAKDTACEGLKLQIEHKPLQARCKGCNRQFDVVLSQPQCSQCGGGDFELLPDAPLVLEEIDFQTDDDDEKN